MTRNYLLVKNKFNKEIAYIDYDRVSGFKFKPVNKGDNTISVNQMVIISPTFIEKVLTRKTKRKLELYLEFIVKLLDEDDDTDDYNQDTIQLSDNNNLDIISEENKLNDIIEL